MKHRVFLIAAALCAAVACLSITGCGEDDAAPNRADAVKTSERMPQTYFEGAEILNRRSIASIGFWRVPNRVRTIPTCRMNTF